jgi:hypothetical protein
MRRAIALKQQQRQNNVKFMFDNNLLPPLPHTHTLELFMNHMENEGEWNTKNWESIVAEKKELKERLQMELKKMILYIV